MGQIFIVDDDIDGIFEKVYQNVYAEIYEKEGYYEVLIYCPYAKDRNSIKKVKIFDKRLLIDIGERKYRYGFEGKEEYIISGLACMINLPLPDNTKDISEWNVKNGLINVKIGKSI